MFSDIDIYADVAVHTYSTELLAFRVDPTPPTETGQQFL